MKLSCSTAFTALLSISLMSGCATTNYAAKSDGDVNVVQNAVWRNQITIDAQQLLTQAIPNDVTRIYFIRENDEDAEQTRVNLSINDRFQVSLHPGNFTQVDSCVGINKIAAKITGLKTNDLLLDAQEYTLSGGQSYFFSVDVDENMKSSLQPISEASARQALVNKGYQSHQISRVVPNCALPPPPPVPAPVLKEKVRIELIVLFDNDKAEIKPRYFSEIKDVADFMNKYSNTRAVIEGHTDSNASDSYNLKLSQRRANAVKEMLTLRYGIANDRLMAIGYGESRPVADNATAEGRQLNRRVIAAIEEK